MSDSFPAVSLAASPGKAKIVVDAAVQLEASGFSGIYCPSFGDALGLSLSIAHATSTIEIGTSIQPIYFQHPAALATTARYLHEVSDGRFRLGLGVSHAPVVDRLGVSTGKPLSDMRTYVAEMQAAAEGSGGLGPITLATLRDKMVTLSVEVADGAVWANGSRNRMQHSLGLIPQARRDEGFFVGNMIPTVIDDDIDAARAKNRRTLSGYVRLPNYRNYWAETYPEEMAAIGTAVDAGDNAAVAVAMTDRWLDDVTLSGSAGRVRDEVQAWFDTGVSTPILVPGSTTGGQAKAIGELIACFA
ncbi:MAG: LLM class flavin-dependent oxidoreductase [Actinobacteria bacterium]|nr:LLM class flavin-dependent oxidoreductase [Actinomycetota bacterium]